MKDANPGRGAIRAALAMCKLWVSSCRLTISEARKLSRPDIEERSRENLKRAEAKRDELVAELALEG